MLFLFFICSAAADAQNYTSPYGNLPDKLSHPVYFIDGKEIDIVTLKKTDPCIIEKSDYLKPAEAAKTYGAKGRFGVYKLSSRKKTVYADKGGVYRLTLYTPQDSASLLRREYSGNDLDALFQGIVKEYPNAYLVIDDLRFINNAGTGLSLTKEAGAFNIIHAAYAADSLSASVAELLFYSNKVYISGSFYFSGSGFQNVLSCSAADMPCIRNYLKLCRPGTTVVLEACRYNNPKDGNGVISKVIKLN